MLKSHLIHMSGGQTSADCLEAAYVDASPLLFRIFSYKPRLL